KISPVEIKPTIFDKEKLAQELNERLKNKSSIEEKPSKKLINIEEKLSHLDEQLTPKPLVKKIIPTLPVEVKKPVLPKKKPFYQYSSNSKLSKELSKINEELEDMKNE
ncbi:hypothetical protein HYU21_00790, partial [Candidatus Woesearchaeota archaeon]|nr:hypothetical protein [Candidatus Woesearchaeota archaeon]